MIERSKLRAIHGSDLPLHILEQDYLQTLFLQECYRETDDLVFKGGTYFRHAHGLDRFSEDLDFTLAGDGAVVDSLERAAAGLDRYGIPGHLTDVERHADAVLARLQYEGPLFDGTERSRGSIELDISTREEIFTEPTWTRLFAPYPELRAVTARCLSLAEAFAEKLRALATRTRGRDLYDCWFLLGQNVAVDAELFARKMAVLDEPARVRITVSEREYDRDLSVLVAHPPAYATVCETVAEALRAADVAVDVSPS